MTDSNEEFIREAVQGMNASRQLLSDCFKNVKYLNEKQKNEQLTANLLNSYSNVPNPVLSKWLKNKEHWCGPSGTDWVPEMFPFACMMHDKGYDELAKPGAYLQHKLTVDFQFLGNMLAERPRYYKIATLYFGAVLIFGFFGPYENAQENARNNKSK